MSSLPAPSLWRVFPSILLPIFLAVVDGTIVASALPAMAGAFGEVDRVSWVVASYLVASTVAAPVYGRLGDAWGRRRLLLAALTLFVAASALCALASGILTLTAARVLQGIGGGGLMVLSQALLGENVERRQLGRAQGVLAAVIVVSSTFGPVAGGVLTQLFGWPSIFLINVPLGGLAVLLALRLPARGAASGSFRFDWLGLLLFAGFVVPLLLALEQGQRFDGRVAGRCGLQPRRLGALPRAAAAAGAASGAPVVPAQDASASCHVAGQRHGRLLRRVAGQRGDAAAHPSGRG